MDSPPCTWIVVPVRSLTEGKRRLAGVLEGPERAALVRRLLVRTLEAAAAAGPPVLVVSPDPAALALARGHGAAGLAEPRPIGLNHALELAAREAVRRGAGALLVVPADLPGVGAADLRAMLPAAGSGPAVRVAPDEAGTGTNALYVRPPGLLAFRYGEGSCALHLEQARTHGVEPERVDRPGLRFDLDTPDDLARHERHLGERHGEDDG